MNKNDGKLGFPGPNEPLVSMLGMLSLGALLEESLSQDELRHVAESLNEQVGVDMAENAAHLAASIMVDLLGSQN